MAVFESYQEIPVNPVVEWHRYAMRHWSYLKVWPQLIRYHIAYTITVYLLMRLFTDRDQAMGELMSLFAAAAVAVILVPLGQFVFYFITAFHGLLREENERLRTQYEEANSAIQDLSKKVDSATKDKNYAVGVAASLTHLRESAIIKLLNRRVQNDEELETLKKDISEWESSVIKYMEGASIPASQISTFRVLGTYNPGVKGGYNAEHNKELAMLWERLKRLLYIAVGMEDPATSSAPPS